MSIRIPRSNARATELRLAPLFGRQLFPLAVLAIAFVVLRHRMPELDLAAVWNTVHQVSAQQWGLAALATLASFWAVARYDQLLHGLMDTQVSPQQARQSGTAAIAIAQFAGFGVLSSALVRWRLLPDLSLPLALRISLAVSLSFLAAWAVVTALAVLATGAEVLYLRQAALGVLALAMLTIAVLIAQPKSLPALPGVNAVFTIIGLAFIDTIFASAALYILLPPDIIIAPTALFTAFLVALGCGLIGGTPGGVGPFEVALLAMLPAVPHEPLLATALAFRIVYYVLPASLALLVLLRGPLARQIQPAVTTLPARTSPYLGPELERIFWASPRAEANLVRQGQFALLRQNNVPSALIAPTGQSLVMLADAVIPGANTAHILQDFQHRAARMMRAPMVYKCGPRTASCARALGWQILPVASEAWLRPALFSTDGSNHRQLRRLLRKAKREGIRVVEAGRDLPLDAMQAVSDSWACAHDGERGFSMGRFGRDYVSCQRVFLAYQRDDLIAFITLHEVHCEWTLDLMRHVADVPAGTLHLLVRKAIESAAAVNCPRLSLAAVPCAQASEPTTVAWMRRHLIRSKPSHGLRRFKASFDPNWSTLYAAAPSRFGLGLGLWAVFSRINRPG